MSPEQRSSDRVILGLPSKGRLMDSARACEAMTIVETDAPSHFIALDDPSLIHALDDLAGQADAAR